MSGGKPETSIVIRTYNEEKHLGNLLQRIKEQEYSDYEIVLVDSGSTDRTLEIARSFSVNIIQIKSQDFTFGYALNIGCRAANGTYLVFVSAHVLPADRNWLENLIRGFEHENVAMVYGRHLGAPQSKFSEKRDFARLFSMTPENAQAPLSYANNANAAVHREAWEKYPFDEYLFGLEDIDFARKITADGQRVRYEPRAAIYHIHEERWPQVFNRYRREAIAAVRIGLTEPPQSGLTWPWFLARLAGDILASFPYWTRARLEEILRFRYYQWKGSRVGFKQGKNLNLQTEKEQMFFQAPASAVAIRSQGHAELGPIDLPQLKPSDILVKVEYVGVCRTDLEVLEGSLGYYRSGLASYPIVPGHEFSGTILRIGPNNRYQERFRVGQRIVGECILSREPNDRREVGVINQNGAYATHIVVPGWAVHPVPEGLDMKEAALAEPLAVVLRALRRIESHLRPGSRVAVIGVGSVGNLAAQALHHRGCRVTAFDNNEKRLALLKGIAEEGHTELSGLGSFDIIVELTGVREVLEKALSQSRFDSALLVLGFPYGKMSYNFEDVVGNEKVIVGSVGGDERAFDEALALLPHLDLSAFTNTILPLEEFETAWQMQREGKQLKILLKP
ncbi:glycosyltransferase [Candidatus Kaiserbacteria bacterium]|nr:glycosyltransferase [Candidatus Kaiserbacteria bacterium]